MSDPSSMPATSLAAQAEIALLRRKLARADAAREAAEALLEERARALDKVNSELRARESDLLNRLDFGNRMLLRAQRTAAIATVHRSADGDFLFSAELAHILGLAEGTAPTPDAITRAVHPLDRCRVAQIEAQVCASGDSDVDYQYDHRIRRPDGTIRWLRWTWHRASDDVSAAVAMSGTVQDITEQRQNFRRAETLGRIADRRVRQLSKLAAALESARALQEQGAARLSTVLESLPQGVAVFDANLRLTMWNSRLGSLVDIPPSQLAVGMDYSAYAATHWRHDPHASKDHLLRDVDGHVIEHSFSVSLGGGRLIDVSVRMLPDGGMVKTYADVSARRRAEMELRAQGIELARRIEELEVISSELHRTNGEVERAHRSKSQFLAMMSHDIRTPMNGVLGMLEIVAQSSLDDVQRRQLALARDAGEKLRVLLDDAVEMVRAENSAMRLSPVTLDPAQAITDAVDFWRATQADDKILLVLDMSPSLPAYVDIDATRLRQLLDNLISNAIKYTGTGRVRVTAAWDAGQLTIAVEDSGPGIALHEQRRLFEEFHRVGTDGPSRPQGTGLGLAICRRIVTAMEGSIGVDSQPGQGSRFWFQLPVAAVAAPIASLSASGNAATVRLANGQRPRLLIAEDVETNRIVLAMMVSLLGCDHESVVNGADAVTAAQTGRFDAILMDVEMPVMDGLEATRVIRSLPGKLASIPIIGVTAHALWSESGPLLDAGMAACLSKPVDRELLAQALNSAFQIASAPARVAKGPPVDVDAVDALLSALPGPNAAHIVDLACQDMHQLLGALTLAIEEGDEEAARRASHSLKGVAGNIGARALLAQLDDAYASADTVALDRLVAETENQVRARLRKLQRRA